MHRKGKVINMNKTELKIAKLNAQIKACKQEMENVHNQLRYGKITFNTAARKGYKLLNKINDLACKLSELI